MYGKSLAFLEVFLLGVLFLLLLIKIGIWILYQRPKYKMKHILYFNDLQILKSKTQQSERLKRYQNGLSFVLVFILAYLILSIFFLKVSIRTLL